MKMYVSLDEARTELKRRWADVDLKKRIEAELGDQFMPAFKDKPRAMYTKQLCSPDNSFAFFYNLAKYLNVLPIALEFVGDIFVSFNDEKMGLARLRVLQEDGSKATMDIMNYHDNGKKPLRECLLKSGENLVDFHHKLLALSGYDIELLDNTEWFRSIGRASDYYYPLLLHCVAHGIIIESFLDEGDEHEDVFTHSVVMPAIKKIQENFGLSPLICKLYPSHQDDDEDFYWWSYPPHVNRYLLDYAKSQQLKLKPVVFK